MHLPREEQTITGAENSADTGLNDSSGGFAKLLLRITRKARSGAYFTLKFVKDLGWIIILAAGLIFVPVPYPTFLCCLKTCVCCVPCLFEMLPDTRSPCSLARAIYQELRQTLRELVEGDYDGDEGPLEEKTWLQPDSIEQAFSTMGAGRRTCSFKTRKLAGLSSLQLTNGCSAIILESGHENNKLQCIFYRHTYRPRGPVGSMVHYCRLKLSRPMNHPTHFLLLFGGRLCFTQWNSERHRFKYAQHWLGTNSSKGPGQVYHQGPSTINRETSVLPLPTRLLDIGDPGKSLGMKISQLRNEMESTLIKLWTTPAESNGQYVALSHRWGNEESCKLTKDNIQTFHNGISFSSLPKTYQDAVVVARKLGYRYIWIDALCIVQDDPDDWLRESIRMASVYNNSACTFAIHTSRHSGSGFLDDVLDPVPTFQVRSKDSKSRYISNLTLASSFHDQVTRSFLSQRGWVFQERILSRRILHFVKHHIFFEDESGVKADDIGGSGVPIAHSWTENKLNTSDSFRGSAYWYNLVQRYSVCSLTFDKDRLPAIASLAKEFYKNSDTGSYLFGLWETSLHLGLLWVDALGTAQGMDSENTQKLPPSWSWARCKGQVIYPQMLSDSFSKASFKPAEDSIPEEQSDAAFHGISDQPRALLLKGPVLDLPKVLATRNLEPIGSPFFDPPVRNLYKLTSCDRTFGSWVALDGVQQGAHYFNKLSCLLVCSHHTTDNDFVYRHHRKYYFILLEETENGSAYRRIGIGVTTNYPWKDERIISIQ
ncbi:HET-domain-containing protein [Fusarium austroafricanum]|uniref:HET-domain-containing protein n=1 Tax=Fusarium austroafricanum TaxID=2364996 RepID=A0A8H4P2Q2_9HYPO|nr:HET-domain-containing protein [Fusarium austroafricanum]